MKEVKMGMGRRKLKFQQEGGGEWRLLGFLYADDLGLCGVGGRPKGNGRRFAEVRRRRGLKVSAGKRKV